MRPTLCTLKEAHHDNPQEPRLNRRRCATAARRRCAERAEAYARWLEHMQRTRTRHAAITRNLYTWSNYKSWADKMRHRLEGRGAKT